MNRSLTIATRGSQLALWQANWVKSTLENTHSGLTLKLLIIKTKGDKILDVPLAQVGGKGLFVKEIEEALLDRRADLAVHSLKDLPAELPEGLVLGAVPEREDPRDALVSKEGWDLAGLPQGAKVGTSSLRRKAQILASRPDLNIVDLRGNLDTRVRKLQEGQFDAIVVAVAGLKRLGLWQDTWKALPAEDVLSAVGQGILGIECREDDAEVRQIIGTLEHAPTRACALAERAFSERLGGSCQVPLGAFGTLEGGTLHLQGGVFSLDGMRVLREEARGKAEDGAALGRSLAETIMGRGGKEILEELLGPLEE